MSHKPSTSSSSSSVVVPGPDWILLSQGAEARVWKVPNFDDDGSKIAICKERFSKSYRHRDLDERLTKQRCRMEARVLEKCRTAAHIRVPRVLRVENTNYPAPALLYLEYMEGIMVRDYLEEDLLAKEHNGTTTNKALEKLAHEMGSTIARLHAAGMIHGDLTTSNMMIRQNKKDTNNDDVQGITLIDFGLAKNTTSAEERAVDLYVLERALQSTHPTLPETFWETALKDYAETTAHGEHEKQQQQQSSNRSNNSQKGKQDTLSRLDQVRQRGRKRECFG